MLTEYTRYRNALLRQGLEPMSFTEWRECEEEDAKLVQLWGGI